MKSLLASLATALLLGAPLAAQAPFAYDRTVPIAPSDSVLQKVDGIQIRTISFRSPKGGRATGLLFLPSTPGRHPALLLGHGAPGSSRGAGGMALGVELAKHGAVVLALDAPFARRSAPPIAFAPQDSVDQVQLAVDWRRALDYLSTRSDVDSTRFGYVGTSYGGAQGSLLVGIEPRIRAAVLRVADGGFLAHFTDPCDTTALGVASITGCLTWTIPEADLSVADRERWAAAMRPIEPMQFVGASRAALLFQNGRQDELVPPARARRLHAAVPRTAEIEWYDAPHRLPQAAVTSALHFLARHLGMAPPQ